MAHLPCLHMSHNCPQRWILCVFIDIKGAFNKTTLCLIQTALHVHDGRPTWRGWVRQILELGKVRIIYGLNGIRAIVDRGYRQGEKLSSLLLNLVVGSLLCGNSIYAIGFADDIVILLNGKFEELLCHLMQEALYKTFTKLSFILFSNEQKSSKFNFFNLFGSPLELSNVIKYLGFVLACKLNWSKHLEIKTNRTCWASC